jgi:hypothetical protein
MISARIDLTIEGDKPPTVTDVDRDLAKRRVEDRPTRVPFHVVRGLVEVAHPRDVVLAVLANHVALEPGSTGQ